MKARYRKLDHMNEPVLRVGSVTGHLYLDRAWAVKSGSLMYIVPKGFCVSEVVIPLIPWWLTAALFQSALLSSFILLWCAYCGCLRAVSPTGANTPVEKSEAEDLFRFSAETSDASGWILRLVVCLYHRFGQGLFNELRRLETTFTEDAYDWHLPEGERE